MVLKKVGRSLVWFRKEIWIHIYSYRHIISQCPGNVDNRLVYIINIKGEDVRSSLKLLNNGLNFLMKQAGPISKDVY